MRWLARRSPFSHQFDVCLYSVPHATLIMSLPLPQDFMIVHVFVVVVSRVYKRTRHARRYVAGLVNLETDPGEAQLGTLAGVNGTIIDPRLYDLSFLLNKKNELMAIYNASIDDPSTYNFIGRAQSQVRLLPFLLSQ
jgi:hypothetical protein